MPTELMLKPNFTGSVRFHGKQQYDFGEKQRSLSLSSDISQSQFQTNLLSKTLSSRIKAQAIPQLDVDRNTSIHFLHLASANKERNTSVSLRGTQRLNSRSREDRKNRIRDRLTRQREWEQRTRPDTDRSLPIIENGLSRRESISSNISVQSTPAQKITYGESNDHIGVEKRGGVFKHINVYAPPRYKHSVYESPYKVPVVEYEDLTIPHSGCISTDQSKLKRTKGLRVTFSSNTSCSNSSCDTDTRGDDISSKTKSKSSIPKIAFISSRDRIASVGVAWDIPHSRVSSKSTSTPSGQISRDLHPVTSGLNNSGVSENKTKWRVRSSQNFNRPFAPLNRYQINRRR